MKLSIQVKPVRVGVKHKVLVLAGHLESNTVPQFEETIKAEIATPPGRWIMDMRGVEYISSAGLAVLVGLKHDMDSRSGRVAFFGVTEKAYKVFKLLGMLPLFEFFSDEAAAQAAFEKG